MPKITLEKSDIEGLIKTKYPNAEIVGGLKDDIEVVIRVKELPQTTLAAVQVKEPFTNPELPRPAHIMQAGERGTLPKF